MTKLRIRTLTMGTAFVLGAIAIVPARSQGTQPDQANAVTREQQELAWKRLKEMVGVWKGDGQPGPARVEQRYELMLQDQFLHARTTSISESDSHEDWEVVSFDRMRGKVVLRQFVSEGYVNQYVLDQLENSGRTPVFDSESCENSPPGFRTRQTLTFDDDNRISQQLELAPSGKQFSRCSSTTLARVK